MLANETIADCLTRMENEGYRPVRRIEKPIFKEVLKNNQTEYQPVSRKIIFDALKLE
ncbi:NETI motif-containing protein [Bacillus sporothermodurans]|uniref:NETI motif-containing protein n=1 Tax=Heyndrickxia sporothermodurans TaxID=46224 RepID=UPI00192B26AF|nr:NETI motif-containing protein [Heyndrickxia sporothermodurans]MBL5773965.1 NETI motif-containing protein [Heyndrickxia sporothermodurans]MBL5834147.1 NETI motif-containing protein [Heyndrickxia sporothermodurans]MBL5879459.1 NETI motif-containing protein [Heyndrickxia sporothermodurans]MBL5890822.1 NETI motif-containing protein [Heyndrickxia sporothermodurans]